MQIDVLSFLAGGVIVVFCYNLYQSGREGDLVEEVEELEIFEGVGRTVTLSCQTCRKLKRHKEIEDNLFQCARCKRLVDLRKNS